MIATTCCTRKPIVYQSQLRTERSQISSTRISSRKYLTTPKIKLKRLITNDINNNINQQMNEIFQQTVNNIDAEEFLSYVGLRLKTKMKSSSIMIHRPLAKRLIAPICLLSLPKNLERVRQALYILLPFLKFLSINTDLDQYCLSNEQIITTNLQLRTSKSTTNKSNKHKVSKEEFLVMATNTFRNHNQKTPMTNYIHSIIQCQVVIDRLDRAMIDKLMINTDEYLSMKTKYLNEKTLIKHQPPMTTTFMPINKCKRLKLSDNHNDKYRRIYLKCFVCSKREFIQCKMKNSDILHSHWLKHGNELVLNIYDSEIEQILTRVVEFFYFPRRHVLEGKIQTIYILNSKEIRKTPLKPFDDDDCIVLD